MSRNLLLMTYCFPPANIIGAVRPYQIARFFQERGWTVYVVSTADSSIQDTYSVDCTDIHSFRLQAPKIISWLNTPVTSGRTWVENLSSGAARVLKFIIRSLIFPEHYVFLKQQYGDEAQRLSESIKFDLVISSALPFIIHVAAKEFCAKTSLPWVADNRDLWASSPYRRAFPLRRFFDCCYEKHILSRANLVVGISNAMIDYYRNSYNFENVLLVMNGFEILAEPQNEATSPVLVDSSTFELEIVYAGILYGGIRDPSPLLEAISTREQLVKSVSITFYGSEPQQVSMLKKKFPQCSIKSHARITKNEIIEVYQNASVLLVILGDGAFENGVLTGKFFEYLSFHRPILAIASEQSELAMLINQTGIGLASKKSEYIAAYLLCLLDGSAPRIVTPPKELSINHQMALLYNACEKLG